VNDPPPAEILGRLRPIPTYRDHPATVPHDIDGVAPDGSPRIISIPAAADPFLLLFLSSSCQGCLDLWEGTEILRAALPDRLRLVILTRGPDREDAGALLELAVPGTEVIMSSQAYEDYGVGGPPFLVVVSEGVVKTEGVAWGVEETTRATLVALDRT
jgi:hypothetical protein